MAIVNTNFNSDPIFKGIANLRKTEYQIQRSIEKLSTGSRLVTASEDPSGKGIANRFEAQVRGINTAIGNAEDAMSLLQTAAGGLDETTGLLTRMRDLALKVMNQATLTTDQVQTLHNEFVSLRDEITRSANAVTFNGLNLLDGTFAAGRPAQVGPDQLAAQQLTIQIQTMLASAIADGTTDLVNVQLTSDATNSAAGHAASAIGAVDTSLTTVSDVQTSIGVQELRLDHIINTLASEETNTAAALSRVTDADMASEVSHFAKLQLIAQAGTSVIAQGINIQQRVVSILDQI